MALKGDQIALIRLLCERGQGYEDISELLGVTPEEVRARARAALAELGGSDPDSEVGLTDYLLGQADPIGRADAVRYLQGDPETLELAQRIEARLAEVAPEARLPKLPEPRGKRRRAATPGPGEKVKEPSSPDRLGAPREGDVAPGSAPAAGRDRHQTRLLAGLATAAVLLLFVVLAVAGAFSGDEDSTVPTTVTSGETTSPTTGEDTRNITTIDLAPANGSGVGGTTRFGLVDGQQLYVDVELQGLDPSPSRTSAYFVWLMVGEDGGYPVNNPAQAPIVPDQNGFYSGRIAVPQPIAVTVGGQATSVRVSSSEIPEIAAAAKRAARENAPILPFIGTELASGEIPLAADSTGGATAPPPEDPGSAGAPPAPAPGGGGGPTGPAGGGAGGPGG